MREHSVARSLGGRSFRKMRRVGAAAWCLLGACILGVSSVEVRAQEDFRHLDRGRPSRVEDAYPIKFREWEWELGTGGFGAQQSGVEIPAVLELKVGLFRNAQFGAELHGVTEHHEGSSGSALEELGFHLLYNLNQEGFRSPAVAVRADLAVPGLGESARSDLGGLVRAMVTRSFGTGRVHLNGGHVWASEMDGADAIELGIAYDRAWGLTSRLFVVDVLVEVPRMGATRVTSGVGLRAQVSKRSVVDVGVFTRWDEWQRERANVGLVVGLSRAFGFSWWGSVPPSRNSRIR